MTEYSIKFRDETDYRILAGRDIIYLDSNFWIDLADEKTKPYKTLKEILKLLVRDKKIFCPLNFPTLTELYKQDYDSMLRVGELMNELSLNFTYSHAEEIWSYEVVKFIFSHLNNIEYRLKNEILFVPYLGYLSSRASLIFPDDYDSELEKKIFELLKGKMAKVTLPEFIKLSNGFKNRRQRDLAYKIREEWNDRWERNKGNRKKIRIELENIIAKEKLLPLMKKINSNLTPDQLIQITNYINSFPRDKQGRAFNSIISNMPSMRNEIEILSLACLDNQKK